METPSLNLPMRDILDQQSASFFALGEAVPKPEILEKLEGYTERVSSHLLSLMESVAMRNAACFSDEMTCAYRYVFQKACINPEGSPPDFAELRRRIRDRLTLGGRVDDLENYVAELFGFLPGKALTMANIDVTHPNIRRVHKVLSSTRRTLYPRRDFRPPTTRLSITLSL